jgi:hypothetical protein
MMARLAFFLTVADLFPQCLVELRSLADRRWSGEALEDYIAQRPEIEEYVRTFNLLEQKPVPDFLIEFARRQAIEDWARKWNLLDRGKVPDWLIDAATFMLACARSVAPNDPEAIAYGMIQGGGEALTQPEERRIELPESRRRTRALPTEVVKTQDGEVTYLIYNPEFYPAGWYKRRLRGILGPEAAPLGRRVDEIVRLALSRGGKIAPWKCERAHLEWAVRAVLEHWSYQDIADGPEYKEWVKRLPRFEPWEVIPIPYRTSIEAIREAVKNVLELVGLRRRRGRPKRFA